MLHKRRKKKTATQVSLNGLQPHIYLFLLLLVTTQSKCVHLVMSRNAELDIFTFPKLPIFLWKFRHIVTFESATSEASKTHTLEIIYAEQALYIYSTSNTTITQTSQTCCLSSKWSQWYIYPHLQRAKHSASIRFWYFHSDIGSLQFVFNKILQLKYEHCYEKQQW